jgi:glycosyltransferase involved in cell wall biosynthesis
MKPFMFIMAPVETRSGYGDHSRDLITSLIDMDMFDIKIKSVKWGNTPMTGLDKNREDHMEIERRLYWESGLNVQPDVMIHIGVPNEFQNWGKFNVGITAGIETTQCSSDWLQGLNKMDMVIVPSEHSKNVFQSTVYDQKDEKTDEVIGKLKCEVPIHVLYEGVDTDIFKKTKEKDPEVEEIMSQVNGDCFLFVGHWLKGDLGHDRKDVSGLVKVFCETFKNQKKRPSLVMKTSGADFSHIDRRDIRSKIQQVKGTIQSDDIPDLYFIHGDLSEKQMNHLYNHSKVKAHISFTKGEGYGRPLAEASCSGKIVIAPKWGGQVDFLDPKFSISLNGQVTEVHDSAIWEGVIDKGAGWFYVDYALASTMIKNLYNNQRAYKARGHKQSKHIYENFSLKKMKEDFKELVKSEFPKAAKQIDIKLPDLPSMELPTLRSS